ncbi:MAG: hypothetical protein KF708_14430 [Pirellulales bacterium]|nr:hypothetical protein [Pirellulales bacterium]
MAREESDREDLLREATALVERVELAFDSVAEHVVVGFRRTGQASFFFGVDPALHFNDRNELRRAYAQGRLLKAERGRLVSLSRQRTEREVALVRHELDAGETAALLENFAGRLRELCAALDGAAFRVVGQVPAEGDVLTRVRAWLASLEYPLAIAAVARL